MQRAGPPDDDHAGRRAAWRGAADDTAIATILTTAHDIHRIIVAFSSGRISTAHDTAAAARADLAVLRQNAPVTAAHAEPVPCRLRAPRHQPAGIAVHPSTPTTHLDPP